MTEIVVGVDGSEGASRALRWAAREATRREMGLTALLVWGLLDQHHPDPKDAFDPGYSEHDAKAALDGYVERALGPKRAELVTSRVVNDLAPRALIAASSTADLLVVGARGRGGFAGLLLGSVSQHCLQHARCPVAVVRTASMAADDTMSRIVVGVDGSDGSRHALQWAVDEARAHGAVLEIVHAWPIPYGGGYVPFGVAPIDPDMFEGTGRQFLEHALDGVEFGGLAHTVERTLVPGSATHALLDAAKDADLVVVGSRGLGGFTGHLLLLGSVSYQVSQHAPCPVVVVPISE